MVGVEHELENILLTKKVVVSSRDGLNLLLARKIAVTIISFKSDVSLVCHDGMANARYVLEVLSLSIFEGEALFIVVKGEDAQEGLSSILNILNGDNFEMEVER